MTFGTELYEFQSFNMRGKKKRLISSEEKCRKRFYIFIDFRFTRFLYAKRLAAADVVAAASSFYPTLLPNLINSRNRA